MARFSTEFSKRRFTYQISVLIGEFTIISVNPLRHLKVLYLNEFARRFESEKHYRICIIRFIISKTNIKKTADIGEVIEALEFDVWFSHFECKYIGE